MFRNIKIGTKILCVILLVSLLTLLIISAISYTEMLNLTKYSQDANIQLGITASERSRVALLDQAEEYLQDIVIEESSASNAVLQQVNIELTAMAQFVELLYRDSSRFNGKDVPFVPDTAAGIPGAKYMLAPGVSRTPAVSRELHTISSAEYAFSVLFDNNSVLHNIYLGTNRGISYRYSISNAYNETYDPRTRSWYTEAMANPNKTIWLDTYVDAYGVICVTCARAYRDETGALAGIVATDIALDQMTKKIISLHIGTSGYAFLLDTKGDYIAHPDYDQPGFNKKPFETATGSWRELLEAVVVQGKYDPRIAEMDGKERYFFSSPLAETGWILFVGIPIEEVVAPAYATKAEIDVFTDNAQHYIRETLSGILMQFIIIFTVSAILVVGFSFALSLTITRPIEELAISVKRIGTGDLEGRIAVDGKDEVAELGRAFNKMVADLQEYIKNLEMVSAEKERINGELSVAANIQNDMLPRIFPGFKSVEWLQLFVKMEPARQVGGDFYDFFYMDPEESKLAFIIADVSGKSVPAALFMVIAKTLLKTHMLKEQDPAVVLEQVNKILSEDNTRCMFVTVFLCSFDLKTGILTYANGGHNKPLLSLPGEPYQFMELKKGIPLGMMETSTYKRCELQMPAGSRLYLYTDGVNEAMSPEGKELGNDRFLEAANKFHDLAPEEFDEEIRKVITEFANGTEQSDDITTMAISFIHPKDDHE